MSASDQKLPIDEVKVADSDQNGNVREQNLPIKLSVESFIQAYSDAGYCRIICSSKDR